MHNAAWKLFLAVGAALTLGYLAVGGSPVLIDVVWLVIIAVSGAAVLLGIRLHRPSSTGVWWLLFTSLACFGVVGVIKPSSLGLAATDPRTILSDLIVLVAYLLIGAVALRVVRYQTPEGDRDGVIDGIIVMVALATVLWTVVIGAMGDDATTTQTLVNLVSPLVPAGVTAACVRLLLCSGARVPSAALMAFGGFAAFAGSLTWMLLTNVGAYAPGDASDLLWVLGLLCAGASALHPSMVKLTQPAPRASDSIGSGRMAVLGIALLATPATLLALAERVTVHIALPVTGSMVLALFVLLRLGRLIGDRERARREVAIRGSHQSAVSSVASEALTDRPIPELYTLAAEVIAAELDDVEAAIVPGEASPPALDDAQELLELQVRGAPGPVATLRVGAVRHRELSEEEGEFLAAIVNVLGAAVQRREAEAKLRHRALHDTLTGLPNRSLLMDRLQHALARRDAEHVAVVFIDLDGFKAVNDTRGHEAGDRLLVELAQRMQAVVRSSDTVARFAGDEFVVVAHPADIRSLEGLATRLLAAACEPVDVETCQVAVGASVGVAVSDPANKDPEELLRRADAAMYAAKAAGGGRVVFSSDPSEAALAGGPSQQ